MDTNTLSEKDLVLVTGFGPFGAHSVNASWEAVKLLPALGLDEEFKIRLVIREIPVEYDYIQENIPKLWDTFKPKLTVHVGVSGVTSEVCLEQQGFNSGYNKPDVKNKTPLLLNSRLDQELLNNSLCKDGVCVKGGPQCIVSDINMGLVCEELNSNSELVSCVSRDPGRYLCDFTYYSSLHIDQSRTAFIHVPPLDKPYSAQQLAQMLKLAIRSMLSQVRSNDSLLLTGQLESIADNML
nr:EOG090X0F1W [Lepidurus arcticus]